MAKKLNIQLKTHWKERMVEFNLLGMNNWECHKEIVAAHHTHQLFYSIEETTERENTTECIETVPEVITHLSQDSYTLKDYDINICFPTLICNDNNKANRIVKAIEESVQITSKNYFSSESYSPVEVIKTFLSCEINIAYSKAIWRKNQHIVDPNLSQPHYVVQLFTDAEKPVHTMWTEKNMYPLFR